MEFLGYSNAAYAVIQHSDKEHDHLHILFTTIDKEGKHIKDSNLRRRSQTVSRYLEMEYNLQETKYNLFDGKSLSEIKAREYFFDNAFKKGMNNPKTRDILSPILATTIYADLDPNKKRSNTEYQIMLEQDVYDKIGNILKEHSHFKSLHKDELIDKLENAHSNATTIAEFKTNVQTNFTDTFMTPLITDNDEDSLNPKKKKRNRYFGK